MDYSFLLDGSILLLRWLHVITAIAWIGASFYFVWLDNSLQKPEDPDLKAKGVDGQLWAVHGGGFYNPQKYMVAPKVLPEKLHWFYWESYTTWMTGFGLFLALYLWNPKAYLIDPAVYPMNASQAVLAALGFLCGGTLAYDLLCRVFGFRQKQLGLAVTLLVVGATYLACQIFSGRAAFLIVGAMMATMMSANVLFWIIPGQKKVVAALRAGNKPDPIYGQRGKQRSVHNTYFTLPVLFCMLSNHFGLITTHPQNWLALVLIMTAAVLIRQFFLLKHKDEINLWYPGSGVVLLAAVLLWVQPAPAVRTVPSALAQDVSSEKVFGIVKERCYGCHAQQPTLMGGSAPKGVVFEQLSDLDRHAEGLYAQVVTLKLMPLGNLTHMTEEERTIIAAWFQQRRESH